MGNLERAGDGKHGCFSFVLVSHADGVIKKAGEMWDWYSEHTSVPERYIFEILLFDSIDFSGLLSVPCLKNMTTSAAMQDLQGATHLFSLPGL